MVKDKQKSGLGFPQLSDSDGGLEALYKDISEMLGSQEDGKDDLGPEQMQKRCP